MEVNLKGTPEEIQEFFKKQQQVKSLEKEVVIGPRILNAPTVKPISIQDKFGKSWSAEEDAVVLAEYRPRGSQGSGKSGSNRILAKRLGRTRNALTWRYIILSRQLKKEQKKIERVKKPLDPKAKAQEQLNGWNSLKAQYNERSKTEFEKPNSFKPWRRKEIQRIREVTNSIVTLSDSTGLDQVYELAKELGRTFYSVLGQVSKRRK